MRVFSRVVLLAVVGAAGLVIGCGENATILNPSFVNYLGGGIVPLTPGPASGFVLVRANNRTDSPIEFVVTIEREVETVSEEDPNEVTITIEAETYRLVTVAAPLANEVGILIDCPVARVGLGEDLNRPTEVPGLFIGTGAGGVVQGFGVPGNVNPLDADAGNFTCGDTLVFEASTKSGAVGNVQVRTFVLRAADQPETVSGPDTFNNARQLLESQRGDDEE